MSPFSRQFSRRWLCVSAVVGLGVAALSACGTGATSGLVSATVSFAPQAVGPGLVTEAMDIPTIDRRIARLSSVAARVLYQSTNGVDNSKTSVSGSVFVPQGDSPEGGWPIVVVAHGTTGVNKECAPSGDSQLFGSSDLVAGLLAQGYIVAVPDYQGLGTDGKHPYLDATTAGYNVIDSVRAARQLAPGASDHWVAFGSSQGGQAVWAANELAADYGKGLDLRGVVSLVPVLDLASLVDAATNGSLTTEQALLLQWVLVGLKESHPDLNIDDYRHGVVAEEWDVLSACSGDAAFERSNVAQRIGRFDLKPSTPAAADRLRDLLRGMSLPKRSTEAPMWVVFGGKDQYNPPAWTDRSIDAACEMGDIIDVTFQADRGHGDVQVDSADWIAARFNGDPPPNSCPSRLRRATS